MDTMKKVLNLVQEGDWSINLDLKDAYFHIEIYKKHRMYLRFCYKSVVYQFRALCFGPTVAPRVFTKITAVVVAYLRKRSLRIATYLDDWLGLNQIRMQLLQNRTLVLNLLFELGFIINKKKSSLEPSQNVTYIGGQFHLKRGLVFPTPERVLGLKVAAMNILQGQNSARDYLVLLGKIASCIDLIPNARLFMRPIQLHLLAHWSPQRSPLSFRVPCTVSLKSHLQWWLQEANTMKGCFFHQPQCQIILTTDASTSVGWGGHMNNLYVQGLWSPLEKLQHVNCLEMEAVIRSVKHFLPKLQNKNVLIHSDNTTVVQYINKQGGTKSQSLCQKAWALWLMALENGITLKAAHIIGRENILADCLSRTLVKNTEWSLSKTVVRKLPVFAVWGTPMMDLFATLENKQTHLFCSWTPQPQAYALDALSIAWQNMYAYAFPPIQLVPRVLSHMKQFHCTLILIAPNWPRQHWFPLLLQMLVAKPLILPLIPDLLSQGRGRICHPNPETLDLTAWLLSTNVLQQRDFQKTLENCSQHHGVKTGSPVPPDKPAGNYKFSLPSSVLKVRSPTTITGILCLTINLACQKVEGGDVVAMGNNHILTQSHLDQRRKVFDVLHENILHYLPKEDKTISTSYTANFHFLNAGRMVPHTVEQSSSAGHATTVAVWWSGQTQISVFSLLKSSKDSVFKPDMVWPYTCRITCTSVSLDTAWIAIGLENGLVVLWDRYIGIQRGVINISDVSSIKAVHFLDSPEVENEPPSYRTKSCAGLLVICGQGSMHTVFCVPGDEIRHTCVFQLSDDDSLMPTKVICLRKLPELILCVLRNGTVQLRNIQESSLLCEVVLPVQYELRTPWHPVTTLAGHDQMLFIRGALKEKDMEGATRSDEEVGDLFVFQLRSFLTLDPFWNKIRSLPSSYHHCTAEERVAASLKERIAQQGLRKSRMQERWFLLRQEIENIEKYKETAVTNFEARHLYTPESVGWEPMLT
ncbi:hypothetical protein ScPMuIL_018240 [Solemya velum]